MRLNCITILAAALLSVGTAHAIEVSISITNSTSSNDNHSEEAAGSAVELTSASSIAVDDEVGSTITVGGRVSGYVASKSNNGYITQTVSITATYTVTASEGVEYNITFNPNFHGMFNIGESGNNGNVGGNRVTISAISGKLNGTNISSWDGAYQDGVSTRTYDQSSSYTLSDQEGGSSTVYTLTYTFSITTDSDDGTASYWGSYASSADAFLWGMDGSLANTDKDQYSSSSTRSADGLFLPATVTITAIPDPEPPPVPEPSTYAAFGTLALLSLLIARRKNR